MTSTLTPEIFLTRNDMSDPSSHRGEEVRDLDRDPDPNAPLTREDEVRAQVLLRGRPGGSLDRDIDWEASDDEPEVVFNPDTGEVLDHVADMTDDMMGDADPGSYQDVDWMESLSEPSPWMTAKEAGVSVTHRAEDTEEDLRPFSLRRRGYSRTDTEDLTAEIMDFMEPGSESGSGYQPDGQDTEEYGLDEDDYDSLTIQDLEALMASEEEGGDDGENTGTDDDVGGFDAYLAEVKAERSRGGGGDDEDDYVAWLRANTAKSDDDAEDQRLSTWVIREGKAVKLLPASTTSEVVEVRRLDSADDLGATNEDTERANKWAAFVDAWNKTHPDRKPLSTTLPRTSGAPSSGGVNGGTGIKTWSSSWLGFRPEPDNVRDRRGVRRLHRIFVYGSLRKDFHNHHFLDGATFAGTFQTKPLYTMRATAGGAFPMVSHGGTTAITGEVYLVTDKIRHRLDGLEGHPTYYERGYVHLAGPRAGRWYCESYFIDMRPTENARDVVPSGDWQEGYRTHARGWKVMNPKQDQGKTRTFSRWSDYLVNEDDGESENWIAFP